ncbi:hypothetical protein Hypma_008798 [Hypsizygus marmoreus]|uniref:Glucose-methanol-choline oxidoreductase N-terminal domain-containing protein n=1 Tax=Hypsizygus marmoreus TaxID=39966 RepID=A0A369JST7_HYPMA|nr:hypothetical protein Hypma_008798 [Hypsizygus marmoreus]
MLLRNLVPVLAIWIDFASNAKALAAYGLTKDARLFSQQSFDIIIVGGGTAGITLAARLAKSTSLNIGVLEAGEFVPPGQNSLVDTPAFAGQSFTDPNLSWGFTTSPQTHLDNRVLLYPRGKMLGGSSGLNAMAWVRPRQEELDIWSRLGIQGGWNWQGLLPYMMKAENVSMGNSSAFPGSHYPSGFDSTVLGRKGPVQVSYDNTFSGVQTPFVESFIRVGATLNENPENGNNIGVFNSQHSVDVATGNRSYAATGYFVPNQGQTNLLVLTGSRVARINFAQAITPLLANGVEFIVAGTTYSVKATREVVLAAGTVQTPQILELSGIGNKNLLARLNISTFLDIPTVGENLQEHNSVPSTFLLKEPAPITLDALSNNATFAFEQLQQYLLNHTGLFTTLPTYSYHPLQTFFSSASVAALVIEILAELATKTLSPFQKLQAEIQIEWLLKGKVGQIELAPFAGGIPGLPTPVIPGRSYISLVAFGQHLFSRGSVHIKSASPLDAPIIDPNFCDFTFDRKILSLGIDLAKRVAATKPLADLIETVANPANITSEEDLNRYIIGNIAPEYNAIGTAALAPKAMGGVVGDDLLVYGTSNLRIVDASIIPMHLATHIQSLVYAIAEKAADIIIAEHDL